MITRQIHGKELDSNIFQKDISNIYEELKKSHRCFESRVHPHALSLESAIFVH